ncbi:hypothetical protein AB4K01_20060 [Serratia fonticola]|uniref:hypothetical protein n=1 Tax=Serratia fonticola TaxID=47917 RepID=UPI0034C5EC7A
MKPNIQLLPPEGQAAALEVIKARLSSPGISAAGASEVKKITEIFMGIYGVEQPEEKATDAGMPLNLYPMNFKVGRYTLTVSWLPTLDNVQGEFQYLCEKLENLAVTSDMVCVIRDEMARALANKIKFSISADGEL